MARNFEKMKARKKIKPETKILEMQLLDDFGRIYEIFLPEINSVYTGKTTGYVEDRVADFLEKNPGYKKYNLDVSILTSAKTQKKLAKEEGKAIKNSRSSGRHVLNTNDGSAGRNPKGRK
jgi:hypothetical protein